LHENKRTFADIGTVLYSSELRASAFLLVGTNPINPHIAATSAGVKGKTQ